MKIRGLGVVKVGSVFIQEDSRPWDAYALRQGMGQFTRESIAMISLNIFQDIMASCRVNTRISNPFAGQFLHILSLALSEDLRVRYL